MWTTMIWITSLVSKLLTLLVTVLNLGTGATLPGYIVLKIFPNFLANYRNKFKTVFVVTGTNGKTTTTKLLTNALEHSGTKVVTNSSGSNLLRGILTTFLLQSDFKGNPISDTAVLEVDEFTLPSLIKYLDVDYLILLNLSRDQLDRYGETDIIFDKWVEALSGDSVLKIFAYAGQNEFAHLDRKIGKNVRLFDVIPSIINQSKLSGFHNEINMSAVFYVLRDFEISSELITESFKNSSHAYGRGERIMYKGKNFTILLAKNPSSYNHNLDFLLSGDFDTYLLILNDKIPDGRDVSWIYDIDTAKLNKILNGKEVYVTGTRYLDMSIRIRYAGVDNFKNISNLPEALSEVIASKSSNICVLPNYSSMLEVRKLLIGRQIL